MKSIHLNKKQKAILFWGVTSLIGGLIALKVSSKILHHYGYEIYLNKTASLPEVMWWVDKHHISNLHKGEYFMFLAPHDQMLTDGESTPVLKIIKGVAGDSVSFTDKLLLMNGKPIGRIWPKTSKGHILTPIESQVILPGCYFAWTSAMRSYDSRYTDIGIVCEKDHRILGTATPLF